MKTFRLQHVGAIFVLLCHAIVISKDMWAQYILRYIIYDSIRYKQLGHESQYLEEPFSNDSKQGQKLLPTSI